MDSGSSAKQPRSKRSRSFRSYFSSGSFAIYGGVFLLVISLVAIGYQPPERMTASASVANKRQVSALSSDEVSVDELVAASVAANIAQTASLPVANNVSNLSQSMAAESVLVQNDTNIVAKPQIVQIANNTRDVRMHTATTGENVPLVAEKYGISPETVKWANNLTSDALEPGKELKILPVNGVLYTTKDGDTIDSLADKYKADRQQLITYNDLEVGGVTPGRQLIIPGGALPETERPGYEAPRQQTRFGGTSSTFSGSGNYSGGSGSANNLSASVGNRYAFGNCTWYAYERRAQLGRPVGSFWGNAATWGSYAASAGYVVNRDPTVGSLMVNGGGYGHVAVVESVNPGVSVSISEMNAYRFGGGFNRIGRGDIPWNEAVSGMYQYIQ